MNEKEKSIKLENERQKSLYWFQKIWFHTFRADKGWVFIINRGNNKSDSIRFEFYLGSDYLDLRLGISNDCETNVSTSIAVPFIFRWYCSIEWAWLRDNKWFSKLCSLKYQMRTLFELHISKDWFTLGFYTKEDDFYPEAPSGWAYHFEPADMFLGERKEISITKTLTEDHMLQMPERGYEAKVTITKYVFKRRLWFTEKVTRIEVEVENGIKHPGKGTTSYNCEKGALYSISTVMKDGTTIHDALDTFRSEVIKCRETYPL